MNLGKQVLYLGEREGFYGDNSALYEEDKGMTIYLVITRDILPRIEKRT